MAKLKRRYPIPPGSRVPENLDESRFERFEITEYGCSSWTPERNGKGACTQVHLRFVVNDQVELAIRLKSAEECDRLIETLKRHRADVWPGPAAAYGPGDSGTFDVPGGI